MTVTFGGLGTRLCSFSSCVHSAATRVESSTARHAVNAEKAFEMLRDHSQHNGHKLIDVAEAIVESHLLLMPPPRPPSLSDQPS